MQLNYVDSVTQIDSSLSIFGAASLGNAAMVRKGDKRFFEDISKDEAYFYSHVPIKSCAICANGIVNDYIKLKELLKGGRLDKFTVSQRTYITACFTSIIQSSAYGGIVKNELILWKEYFYTQ